MPENKAPEQTEEVVEEITDEEELDKFFEESGFDEGEESDGDGDGVEPDGEGEAEEPDEAGDGEGGDSGAEEGEEDQPEGGEPGTEGDSKAITIDGKEYDADAVKAALTDQQTFANVEKAFDDNPVGFVQEITKNLDMSELKALADTFAKATSLELVDPETGDEYEHKADPAEEAKREAAKVKQENEALKRQQQQAAWKQEWDDATKAVGLTYTEADKSKVTHPRNVAYNLWLSDKALTAEQALKKVLAETKTKDSEGATVTRQKKSKSRPTPPRLEVDDPFDEGAAFMKWRRENIR